MPAFRTAVAAEILEQRPGLIRVRLDDGTRAYALTQLTGSIARGDELVVNTTAVDLDLGSGGWHVVHWNLGRRELSEPGAGHLMKLRYTSLQVDTGSGEEDGDEGPLDLGGCPVVVAGVHSQLPVIVAAALERSPEARIVYVMTDGGALPIALSDHVHTLRSAGLLAGTITAGHAFGGDLEALNVPAALVLARHRLAADLIVVAMGPGGAGTASRLGFTALEGAAILDAVAWLRGRPIACARMSSADPRDRHRGLSHHTRTVLDAVRTPVEVPLPVEVAEDLGRHQVISVEVDDIVGMLERCGLAVTTMGRRPDQDPLFFAAAAAAGCHAGRCLDRPASSP